MMLTHARFSLSLFPSRSVSSRSPFHSAMRFSSPILFAVLLLLLSNLPARADAATPPSCLAGAARRDCGFQTSQECLQNGCCWTPVQDARTVNFTEVDFNSSPTELLTGTPWCYAPQSIVGGYAVTSVT